MKSIDFEGVGVTDDGTPVMGFSVEMQDGIDFDGRLHYQIAAITAGDDVAVGLIDRSGTPIGIVKWSESVRRFLETVVDEGGYLGAIEYDNFPWRDAGGHVEPVFAAADAPHTEWVDLNEQDRRAIRLIIETFGGEVDL